jgi:phosphate transport system protein
MENLTFENHIASVFDEELEEIRRDLMNMGGQVEQQLEDAVRAISDADSQLAEQVIQRDSKVDKMELAIDEACVLVIARRQPAASDLRLVVAVTRAVADLERIGDEAKKIAKHALELTESGPSPMGYTEVRHLAQSVSQMLRNSLDAFARFDADAALETLQQDREIDMEYKTALRELVTYMREDPRSIGRVMSILWVVRSLERIGDHAKNLCEQVVFIVKGKDIRHSGGL